MVDWWLLGVTETFEIQVLPVLTALQHHEYKLLYNDHYRGSQYAFWLQVSVLGSFQFEPLLVAVQGGRACADTTQSGRGIMIGHVAHPGALIPELETERLIIRGHTISDFENSASMWADPEVVRLISGQTATETQSWGRILTYAGLWHHLGYGYWAVCEKTSGTLLGEVGFADFKRALKMTVNGVPEIGWAFRTEAQGRGYALEAVTRILEWSDQNLRYPTTYCIFDPSHKRSLKLAEKVGFIKETTGQNAGKDVLVMSRSRDG